jgi:DNA-binding LacI/PurR family transcriptional regulator
MKNKINMEDIAKKAGVSKGLVSIALSGKYGVSDETRLKIIVAASDMKYDINTVKVKKKNAKRKILIYLDRDSIDDVNYWGKIVKGMEHQANLLNVMIVILTWQKSNDVNEFLINAIDTGADGVIFLGGIDSNYINKIAELSIPVVLIDSDYVGVKHNHIRVNNYGAAYEICQYLIDKGFTHICFVGSKNYSYSFRQRYRGVQEFLIDNQLENVQFDFVLESQGLYDPLTYSKKQFAEYISKTKPQVIVCANDMTAVGIYEELKALGISIPDEISIVGFDNIELCEKMQPPLTTMSMKKEYLGECAILTMLESLNNPENPRKVIELETLLIERESVNLKIAESRKKPALRKEK